MRFCILLGENGVMLQTADKNATVIKIHATSGFHALGMVPGCLQTNLLRGGRLPPERMKTSRKFHELILEDKWRTCWFEWCVLKLLLMNSKRRITNCLKCETVCDPRRYDSAYPPLLPSYAPDLAPCDFFPPKKIFKRKRACEQQAAYIILTRQYLCPSSVTLTSKLPQVTRTSAALSRYPKLMFSARLYLACTPKAKRYIGNWKLAFFPVFVFKIT